MSSLGTTSEEEEPLDEIRLDEFCWRARRGRALRAWLADRDWSPVLSVNGLSGLGGPEVVAAVEVVVEVEGAWLMCPRPCGPCSPRTGTWSCGARRDWGDC